MKFLLVSDATGFALTDVYLGYIHAMRSLKVPFEMVPFHELRRTLSDAQCFRHVHSTCLTKSRNFTHIMFIGGLNVPVYVLESLYHVKSIICATEDPHTLDPNKVLRIPRVDYYFSNERTVGLSKKYKNVYYCPTAGDPEECGKVPREFLDKKYHSDILFLGAMYPNRAKYLESLIPTVKRYKLNMKICGHINYMPKSSPLWEYVFDNRTIPHIETVRYYNGAKIVINIHRDIRWNPKTTSGLNPHNRSRFKAESLNPRAYEVPLCQSLQVLDDSRAEAREIFADNEVGFFSDERSLKRTVKRLLMDTSEKELEAMAFRAFEKVSRAHTYTQRLQHILNIISKK